MTSPVPVSGTVVGSTDWSRYDVPALAAMLAEDHTLAWAQVHAWQHTYELSSYQQTRLSDARSQLAETWLPDRSPAAATFMSFIDQLTTSMAATGEAAIGNATALTGILSALAEAKVALDALHETWKTYTDQDRFAAQPHLRYVASEAPHNWQAQLNQQAHTHMATADQTIFENTRRLTAPLPFSPDMVIDSYTIIPTRSPGAPVPAIRPPQSVTKQPASHRTLTRPGGTPTSNSHPPNGDIPHAGGPPAVPGQGVPSSPSTHPVDTVRRHPATASVASVSAAGATAAAIAASRKSSIPSATVNRGNAPVEAVSDSSADPFLEGAIGMGAAGRIENTNQKRRQGRPRTVWEVAQGGPSVIRREPQFDEHDPGPGIIGIDR